MDDSPLAKPAATDQRMKQAIHAVVNDLAAGTMISLMPARLFCSGGEYGAVVGIVGHQRLHTGRIENVTPAIVVP
jgi:hypothetical protein